MKYPLRGEVWLVDLGMAAKIRPCLVISAPFNDNDRALVTLVPHTTSTRGSQFESPMGTRFLKQGAFDAQGLVTVPPTRAIRLLGKLTAEQLRPVELTVCLWLGLPYSQ